MSSPIERKYITERLLKLERRMDKLEQTLKNRGILPFPHHRKNKK